MTKELEPCPFNKDCCIRVGVFDDEGNQHGWPGDEYEDEPFSGLQYGIVHDGECGLGYVEFGFQPTFESIVDDWNTRYKRTCRNVYRDHRHEIDQSRNGFECSECGNVIEDYDHHYAVKGTFNFCSECGSEVVDDD